MRRDFDQPLLNQQFKAVTLGYSVLMSIATAMGSQICFEKILVSKKFFDSSANLV